MSSASKQKRKKYVDLHVIVTIMSSIIVPVCLCSTLLDCLHVFFFFLITLIIPVCIESPIECLETRSIIQ